MQKTTVWFIVIFLVVIIGAVIVAGIYSGGTGGTSTSTNFVATTAPAITSADWTKGPTNAKVTLMEYGDFECPACGAYYPIVKQLLAAYGDKILFVFRNFPLYTIHPLAGIGAQAAEAAGLQGKYWDMNDALYTNQNEWANDTPTDVVNTYFDKYATTIGLDVNKFNTDINSATVKNKIQNDVNGANSASVDHTPTFFINLKQIPNPNNYDEFKADIDAALAAAGGSPTSTATTTGTSASTSVDVNL